jgi:hypothetical protein
MPGEGHDLKEVISGQAQVIQDTMTKIVECEIFYACVAARRLEAAFDLIKGLSPPLKRRDPYGGPWEGFREWP